MEDEDKLAKDQGDGSTERGCTCHLVVDNVEVEAVQTTKYLGPRSMSKHLVKMRLKIELG